MHISSAEERNYDVQWMVKAGGHVRIWDRFE